MLWLRALFVAALSLVFPGAGHAVLRDWVRALLFAGLFVTSVAVFLPFQQAPPGASPLEAATTVVEATPRTERFVLSFLTLFCAIDAGLRCVGAAPGMGSGRGEGTDGATCPSCGKELDEDLDFCHWCTTRIGDGTDVDG